VCVRVKFNTSVKETFHLFTCYVTCVEKTAELLKVLGQNDLRRSEGRKACMERRVASVGSYFEKGRRKTKQFYQ